MCLVGNFELLYDAAVNHLLGGQYVKHVRITDDVLRILVIGQLVGSLYDGVDGAVLFPDLLVAERYRTVYARIRGRILHLCRFRILVEYEDSPLAPVGKYLRLYDREYHRHDQVREEPVLFDPGEFEYDELLGQEVLFGILRYILVSFPGRNSPQFRRNEESSKYFSGMFFLFRISG